MYLCYDQNCLDAVFQILTDIETHTGLKISYDKTTLYRIGSLANTDAKLYTSRNINWTNEGINTLGVDISQRQTCKDENFQSVIAKMKAVAKIWYFRTMTLSGKITVVNSLMASLYVYRMQVLPVLSDAQIKEIEETIIEFIWRGRKPKIPMAHLTANKEDGGMGLVNIRVKHESLLANWIQDCKNNPQIGNLAKHFLGEMVQDDYIWSLNISFKDSQKCFRGVSFWHKLLHNWHKYCYHEPQNKESVLQQIIWFNSMVKVSDVTVRIFKLSPIHAVLQWFINFPKFAEFTEILFYLGKTPLRMYFPELQSFYRFGIVTESLLLLSCNLTS